MPGLSFRVNFNNRLNIEYSRIEKIVDSLILDTSTLKRNYLKIKTVWHTLQDTQNIR